MSDVEGREACDPTLILRHRGLRQFWDWMVPSSLAILRRRSCSRVTPWQAIAYHRVNRMCVSIIPLGRSDMAWGMSRPAVLTYHTTTALSQGRVQNTPQCPLRMG